jgi:hypothetical protein
VDRLTPEPAPRLGAASPRGVFRVFRGEIRQHLVTLGAREEEMQEDHRQPRERPAHVGVIASVHTRTTA